MGSDYASVQTNFGNALRRARVRTGLTQEMLAEVSGLDRTYISGAERGVRNPSLLTLAKLSQALGIGLGELLADADSGAGDSR